MEAATQKISNEIRRNELLSKAFIDNGPKFRQKALSMLRNSEDADECVQEAYLKAVRNFDNFRNESSINTWLYGIVKATAIDMLRKRQVRGVHVPLQSAYTHIPDRNMPTSDRVIYFKRLLLSVMEAFPGLPAEQREVIKKLAIEGMSSASIGEVMGTSHNTVKSRWRHARESLRRKLEIFTDEPGLF